MAKNSVTRTQRNEQRVKYERLREAGRWQPGNFMADPTTRRGYTPAAGMDKVGVKQMPAPTGEAAVGNRLNKVAAGLKQVGPAFRAVTPKQQVVSNVVRERTSPTTGSARTTQPARMATNPVTGKTTGFSSGTKTGTTMTKAGTAYKTKETAYQRQQRMAAEKTGGNMRSTGGGRSGGSRSGGGGGAVGSSSGTRGYGSGGNTGRGDVGGGRRGGGR